MSDRKPSSKPVIVTVDDDPQVLASVARDLRTQYGGKFRMMRADGGQAALEALEQLALDATPVALVIADQRMPGLSGIELLAQAKTVHPGVKTVLLTAYADTSTAITAINEVQLNHYILKPWDPPDEHLYPTVDALLDEWLADFHPEFDGVRIVGNRWSPQAHELRDFLARNMVPFRWIDVDLDPAEAARLQSAAGVGHELPLVVHADGSTQVNPSVVELANAAGLRSSTTVRAFDLVILGGGPAGLAAAVYGASEGLSTCVIEQAAPGGQAGSSSRIENYLGFPNGVSGAELTKRATDQARRLGAEILCPTTVVTVADKDGFQLVDLGEAGQLSAGAVILATGVSYRALDLPGVEELLGRGVFYGASLQEAKEYQGEDIVIVGGANSAGQAAVHFALFARSVTMLVRGPSLAAGMSTYLIDQISRTPNIEVRTGSAVAGVHGTDRLEGITVRAGDQTHELPATGLFIFIGAVPRTEWLGRRHRPR